jgi:DNA-binding beta-propeller fold protein YncE
MGVPTIDRVNPSIGWPGGTRTDGSYAPGTSVIIDGRTFHAGAERERNLVTFEGAAGARVSAAVQWVTPAEINYQAVSTITAAAIPGGLSGPLSIAIDRQGTLFIADTFHHRIVRIAAGGAVSTWGSLGALPAQFNVPSGIATDDQGNVYVVDTMNHRVQSFSNHGGFLGMWGGHGAGLGQYDAPSAIDVSSIDGVSPPLVWVADSNNHRLVRTTTSGGSPQAYPLPSVLHGPVPSVHGICSPRNSGFVYATDPMNKRVMRWAWTGPFNGSYGPAGDPSNLAVVDFDFPMGIHQDRDGYVYVVDQGQRVVRKFDPTYPSFQEIARFGFTIPPIGGPTPATEFVDPVDVAVTALKAAFVLDRQRQQIVQYATDDLQKLAVNVPEHAVSGPLQITTEGGTASAAFEIWQRGPVEITQAFLSQGVVEYPLVAGKRTVIRYLMRTGVTPQALTYHWGSPATDRAVCRILAADGTPRGSVNGEPRFLAQSGGPGMMQFSDGFEIVFHIPVELVTPGELTFELRIDRDAEPGFHHAESFQGSFQLQRPPTLLSGVISHLRRDGTRASAPASVPLWCMASDPGHALDWLDIQQLYSGYAHYNRLFPIPYRVSDIQPYPYFWINGSIGQGITSEDQIGDMLLALERQRQQINEDTGAEYDYMLGIICRDEIHPLPDGQDWVGVTTAGLSSALISVSSPATAAFDVGTIIGHELLHHVGLDNQIDRPFVDSAQPAWNSITDAFVDQPRTLLYPHDELLHDDNSMAEPRVAGAPSEYDTAFQALAAPQTQRVRSAAVLPRPPACSANFTLIGRLTAGAAFVPSASWLGRAERSTTPSGGDGASRIVFSAADGSELLRWPIRVPFGLDAVGGSRRIAADTALLSVTVPCPDASASVALIANGVTVWSRAVPAQPPSVTLLQPTGGERMSSDAAWTFEWRATHPAGAELVHAIEVSRDGGQTFEVLASGLSATRFTWNAGITASGGRVRVRVVSSDGFHRALACSGDIVVDPPVPRVAIIEPRRATRAVEGKPLRVAAVVVGHDAPIALGAGNTEWLLDEVSLVRGNQVAVATCPVPAHEIDQAMPLPIGAHQLRVRVSLATGHTIEDTVPIEVIADSDRDGIPDLELVDAIAGGVYETSVTVLGGAASSLNALQLDATGLPPASRITVRIPRGVADAAAAVSGLALLERTTAWSIWRLDPGHCATVEGFLLAAHASEQIKVDVELPASAKPGERYPFRAAQRQDGQLIGRLGVVLRVAASAPGWIYGNRATHELHRADCAFRKRMNPRRQVPFSTIDAALSQGYNGCAFCLPAYDNG